MQRSLTTMVISLPTNDVPQVRDEIRRMILDTEMGSATKDLMFEIYRKLVEK